MMKRLAATILAASALAGCTTSSPYDYVENWLIREDPVRTFVVPSDVFYVQGSLYSNVAHVPLMYSYAQTEVGRIDVFKRHPQTLGNIVHCFDVRSVGHLAKEEHVERRY